LDATLQALVRQLDLEPLEQNLFRGQSSQLGGKSVFGGQVIGQALVAASRTVEGRPAHSLHAYFLLPGDVGAPIVYEVERIRDGRSFSARRIQAIQHGRPIFSMIASFQLPQSGPEHQTPRPEVPAPEELPSLGELRERWLGEEARVSPLFREAFNRPLAIDFRAVEAGNPFEPEVAAPVQHVWFKTVEPIPADPLLHRCLIAYASDFHLLGTALRPHGRSWYKGDVTMASLDHAIWFHREGKVDDWLLYSMDSPSSQAARGIARGLIHDRAGRLVASVAQEGMVRLLE
jgi:acyl-CoA thioesterase-2